MKLLFFSADRTEVESVGTAFVEAGIDCETRESGLGKALLPNPGEAELWIKHDEDAHKALMVCVEQGIGFAKRTSSSGQDIGYASWDRDERELAAAMADEPEHRKAA